MAYVRKVKCITKILPKHTTFRKAIPYIKDIELLEKVATSHNEAHKVQVLSQLTLKYYDCINTIGTTSTGVMAYKDMSVYDDKTEHDITYDIYYLIRVIVIQAVVAVGIEKSIESVLQTFHKHNFDIEDIYIYRITKR